MIQDRWSTEQQSRLHHGNHALTSSGIRSCRRSLRTRSWIHGIFCRSFRWKRVGGPTRLSGGRGSGGPAETLLFISSPSLLSASFSSVLREGVPRGTRGGDTPPAFPSLWQLGLLVRRTRRRDVHGQNVPLTH